MALKREIIVTEDQKSKAIVSIELLIHIWEQIYRQTLHLLSYREVREKKPSLSNRLKVSNLSTTISNEDLNILFREIGTLLECRRDYDEFGRPIGSATVVYEKPEDATRAYEEYNKAELDSNVLVISFLSKERGEQKSKPSHAGKLKVINQDGKKIIRKS